jgi:hypothetical protein
VVVRVALFVCLICACGSTGAAPSALGPVAAATLPDGPPLITPREVMSYRLTLGGVDLATYDLGAGEITEVAGRRATVVQGHAKTRGLASMLRNIDDVFTSWIDVETGRSLRWTVEESTSEGNVRERADARIAERAEDLVPVDVWLDDRPAVSEPQKVSLPDVWDYNAYLVALRMWEAPAGSTVTTEMFRSRYMWNVTMTIHGEEKLVTALGEFPTLRFDGRAYRLERDGKRSLDSAEREFSVWITNDQGRVPVQTTGRTDYGDIKLTIIDYQPGNGERLRP